MATENIQNPNIPLCPLMSQQGKPVPCYSNCPLRTEGNCSIKVIAENSK